MPPTEIKERYKEKWSGREVKDPLWNQHHFTTITLQLLAHQK